MKCRIITKGAKYRVQYRYKWWPFWYTYSRAVSMGARTEHIINEYPKQLDAEYAIKIIMLFSNQSRKWEVVE